MARLRSHVTFANVVSLVALFVALGGTSYAAVKLSKNSVRSVHIKNGQVKGPDVAKNAINGDKIADGTLLVKDFASGQLRPGEAGRPGDTGPPGQPGATGQPGAAGLPGSPAASAFSSRFPPPFGGGFGPISGIRSGAAPPESDVQMVSPATPIVARDLLARHVGDGTAGGSRGFILRVNGADSALACSYAQPGDTCQNTSDAVTIPAGSLLSIRTTQTTSMTDTGTVFISWRATTP